MKMTSPHLTLNDSTLMCVCAAGPSAGEDSEPQRPVHCGDGGENEGDVCSHI